MHNEIGMMLTMLLIMTMTLWPNLPATALAAINDLIPEPEEPKEAEWEKNVMFKKGCGTTVESDPNVGKAAMKTAETGEEWLKFADEQF